MKTNDIVLDLIKLDLIDKIPLLKNTKTSRVSDQIDSKFAELLSAMGTAILNRGTKTSIDEKKKLYKLFHSHISHSYLLGQKYAKNVMNLDKLISKKDLEEIQKESKTSLARWLKKIEGSL